MTRTQTAAPAPFPRLTFTVFAVSSLVAVVLLLGRSPAPFWIAAIVMSPVAAAGALSVSRRRATNDVQRTEQRLRRLFRPPRRLRPTREGYWFIAITLAVGGAAMNTGNNLLYLLWGMMLSLILASGILAEWLSLRGLAVVRQPSSWIEAGRATLISVTLRNTKRRLPSFSVEVEDMIGGESLDKRCWFLKVPAGRVQRTSYRHTFARRGRYQYSGVRLATRFPFALFHKSRILDEQGEVIVLPRIEPIDHPPPPLHGFAGEEPHATLARVGEFYGLRELRDGDDPRDVHWRTSARRGRLLVREHEQEAARRVTLYLDNSLPGGERCVDDELLDALERAVSLAASLAAHYLGRGFAIRVVARGEAQPWATSAQHLERLLVALALLPTVTDEIPFPSVREPDVESLHIARRGAVASPSALGRLIET